MISPISDNLEEISNYLHLTMHYVDHASINKGMDVFRGYIIANLLKKQDLESHERLFIKDLSNKLEPVLISSDLTNLILNMADLARESSHGAVTLNKVLLPSDIYLGLTKNITGTSFTVGRVKIEDSKDICEKPMVLGLCQPKYEGVSFKNLIVLGKLIDKVYHGN